ncbi:hypothetical protein KIL84_000209 [Mauremys mutica]|uniref:Uncharacterized protein n=1 Tax=Mauremys mutica TaxID=74926 RepID=A0A9D3XFF3_9SAUR|nr:hypothetical protein KIL84_000209 [Mauremys mutica]
MGKRDTAQQGLEQLQFNVENRTHLLTFHIGRKITAWPPVCGRGLPCHSGAQPPSSTLLASQRPSSPRPSSSWHSQPRSQPLCLSSAELCPVLQLSGAAYGSPLGKQISHTYGGALPRGEPWSCLV